MKRIVMFINGIETQGYFSMRLGKHFQKMGYDVFYYDYWEEERSFRDLKRFVRHGDTVMITFNFHGLEEGEVFYKEDGSIYWEEEDIPCFNIVLDHPLYYHKMLKRLPEKYYQISIDRYHKIYMEKYWSGVALGPFLPLAGTALVEKESLIPIKERPIDLIITGNYAPPETFRKYIERIDEEYTRFYMGMIEDLKCHSEKTIEQVAESHLYREIPNATKEEIRETIGNLSFIDLYVRFWLRGETIRQLAENGFRVHTCGKGWDLLECSRHENIIEHGSMNSEECLKMLGKSKVSVNVMPWFKDGAHDRIFNSQLNGAVCLSDASLYLREIFRDGKDILFFRQEETENIPMMTEQLFKHQDIMEGIAEEGYRTAQNGHTWEDYAERLMEYVEDTSGTDTTIWRGYEPFTKKLRI